MCGVFGLVAHEPVNQLLYDGLQMLQHRGQDAAGIATLEGPTFHMHKGKGMVREVFRTRNMRDLTGHVGIGHVRYPTAGNAGSTAEAQPFYVSSPFGIVLAHNGNLVNADSIQEMLTDAGVIFQTTTDSESILNLICQHGNKRGVEAGIRTAMSLIKGAYVLVITLGDQMIGVRDPYGLHPLCLGRLADGWVLASESCALDAIDAEFVRDVEPGEVVFIDQEGVRSLPPTQWCRKSLCVFELIYFARPDSVVDGVSVYDFRRRSGALLAAQNPIEADMVMAVPDSGVPAAIGYAEASGIPYGEGLIKNKYIGRTFIQPTKEMREDSVRIKLSPIRYNIEGKRLIVIDDSIVRGTTCRRIVGQLRDSGAREVHVCITSPPVRYSCYFGIDTPYRENLIAVRKSEEEIRDFLGADSLTYLSEDGLSAACEGRRLYCRACFDGDYPMEVPAGTRPSGFCKEGKAPDLPRPDVRPQQGFL